MVSPDGLSSHDVAERVHRGLTNRSPRSDVRDYAVIVARNLFTGFNAMVAPAAVILFLLSDIRAAVAVSGMAIANTFLSLVQEVRAKIHLDRLSLITESRVKVRRDGGPRQIPAGEVVQDDIILLESGDTVVADGTVIDSQFLEIDESLLTGESDPVRHQIGETILSGSVCAAGAGAYRAEKVGAESFAQKTSQDARRYHVVSSPLTQAINRIVRLLTYTAIGLCVVHLIGWRVLGLSDDEAIRRVAATITTMVPQGLVLSSTLAFIVGAIAMGRRGAVVQRLNAVETMAAVDVICTDKTGTLTTNHLTLEVFHPYDDAARDLLRLFANATVDRNNRNIQALIASLGPVRADVVDQLPFKSRHRYSAVRLRTGGQPRLLVLGAAETLRDRIQQTRATGGLSASAELAEAMSSFDSQEEVSVNGPTSHALADKPPVTRDAFSDFLRDHQTRGLRLLILAEGPGDVDLGQITELPAVPLRLLAVVGLGDELRADAGRTLEALHAQSIAFKVLSGDNAETVRATVSHLDLEIARSPVITGDEVMSSPERDRLIQERSVFGRVAPHQKVAIVESLQAKGHTVAMIGDGVNDVLPIKRADLGIAMGSGSAASKTVAGLVLENDRFEVLPEVLDEGRTIVRNLRRGAKLFLTKNVYSLILILASYAGLGLPFPYVPQQVTLLNWSVIGVPALAIAMSRQRASRSRPFLPEVLSFVLRTGIVFGLGGVAILWHATHLYPGEIDLQRTLFLSMLILLGITTLFRALTDAEPESSTGDRGYKLLGLLAIPIYLFAMYVPPARHFFQLVALGADQWLIVAGYAFVCWIVTVMLDRCGASFRGCT